MFLLIKFRDGASRGELGQMLALFTFVVFPPIDTSQHETLYDRLRSVLTLRVAFDAESDKTFAVL